MTTGKTTTGSQPRGSYAWLRGELRGLFRDALSGGGDWPEEWEPTVDVVETPESITISLGFPGIDDDALDVTVEGDVITVHGRREAQADRQDVRRHVSERRRQTFSRWFRVPSGLDAETVRTSREQGLLMIEIRKQGA